MVKLFDENDTTNKTECQFEWEKLNEHAYMYAGQLFIILLI